MRGIAVAFVVSSLIVGTSAFAAGGKKKKNADPAASTAGGCTEKDDYLDKAIAEANTVCKSKMTIGYTKGTGFEGDQLKPAADGVNFACGDGNAALVAKKITRVCANWDMKLKKVKLSLSGTTLNVHTNNEIDNSPDAIRCGVAKIVGGKLPAGIDCAKHF